MAVNKLPLSGNHQTVAAVNGDTPVGLEELQHLLLIKRLPEVFVVVLSLTRHNRETSLKVHALPKI